MDLIAENIHFALEAALIFDNIPSFALQATIESDVGVIIWS